MEISVICVIKYAFGYANRTHSHGKVPPRVENIGKRKGKRVQTQGADAQFRKCHV